MPPPPLGPSRVVVAAHVGPIMVIKDRQPTERDKEEKQKPENFAELTLVTILAFDDCCLSLIFCQKHHWRASKINDRFFASSLTNQLREASIMEEMMPAYPETGP